MPKRSRKRPQILSSDSPVILDDDIQETDDFIDRPAKRIKSEPIPTNVSDSYRQVLESWIEKYEPITTLELCVHKKKIEQVRDWLKMAFNPQSHAFKLLVLTGPAGCGKTATIKALS